MPAMSNKVYLFSSDGYRESLDLMHYADSIEGVKQLATKYYTELGWTVDTSSFEIDEEIRKITFKFNDLDGTPDEASCYYMVLELVQP